MAGFRPCSKCGEIVDNHDLRALEEAPKTFLCPACIDRLKRMDLL
jgi:formylmethanofuran dehydrogenase subunit E